jgi:hypothetical protein
MDTDTLISRADAARRGTPFLTTDQAAAYLSVTSRLLRKHRTNGTGPVFRRHSRYVLYHIDDLDRWSREHSHTAVRHG